jgi:uncharacterized membrane protein
MENQTTQNEQHQQKPDAKKPKNIGMAVVAYVIFFIPLLTNAKDDPFVKYHVKQGMVLFICSVIVWFIARVMPVIGWVASPILNIAILILLIIGIINAVNGEEKPLPLIGQFSSKLKF